MIKYKACIINLEAILELKFEKLNVYRYFNASYLSGEKFVMMTRLFTMLTVKKISKETLYNKLFKEE